MAERASAYLSPLRYPGGKRKLAPFVRAVIEAQPRRAARYLEPFAGGAGVALRLLVDDVVEHVVINDLDRGIAAFWRAVFTRTGELTAVIRRTDPTIEEWHRQHQIYMGATAEDDLEIGFAAFFLNRTNRSGILDARPIGGLEQTGKWGLAARYNRDDLIDRIQYLARSRARVTVLEQDGIALTEAGLQSPDTFAYIDPPYLEKADDLYLDDLASGDHRRLARCLCSSSNWLLTYDRQPQVLRLYPRLRCATFAISHTAARQHVGTEYAVFADGLVIPDLASLGRSGGGFVRGRAG